MIAETVALLLYVAPRAAVEPVAAAVVEVRWRRRKHKATSVPVVPPDADLAPRKAIPFRIMPGEVSGKWIVIPGMSRGIEDVYSRVPPFNRGKQ